MKMQKDRDEALIKAEFEKMQTPNFDILEGVKAHMEKKSKHFNRKVFIATLAILCLLSASVAVAQGIGRFDRLRTIIGEERAKLVIPISYKDADYSFTTENGIKIWMVATGVNDNTIDIYMMMQDLEGDRLGEHVHVDYSIVSYYGAKIPALGTTGEPAPFTSTNLANWSHMHMETINRDENGVVTLHAREIFSEPIDVHSITILIHEVFYNIREYEEWKIPIDLDIHNPPTIYMIDYLITPDEKNISERTLILAPRQLELIPIDGLDRGISSIGIVNGNLHVQFYELRDPSRRWSRLSTIAYMYLVNPDGDKVEHFSSTSFNTVSDSYAYWNPERTRYDSPYYMYAEQIYEVDLVRISGYRMLGNFRTFESVALDWHVVIDVEARGQQWVESGLLVVTDMLTVKELRITPVSLMVIGVDPYFDETTMPRYEGGTRLGPYSVLGTEWVIYIHTTQGVIPVHNEMFTREGAQLTLVYQFDNSDGFLALCSITTVEISGKLIDIAAE